MGLFKDDAKRSRQVEESDKILDENSPFFVKEAYKMARTNILFSMPDATAKTILITSAFPAEGKTTTAINISISFAQMGYKVLLIDADVRKSTVRKRLNYGKQKGLTDVLGGLCTLEEVIVPNSDVPNMSVMQSGTVPPNPSELLSSQKMKDVIEKCAQMFDYVFVDAPPVNVVTDAVVISRNMSGVLLVVRANYSATQAVMMAVNKFNMANAHLLGFVLNASTFLGYGYNKYGYSYSNRYMNYKYSYSYEYGKDEETKKTGSSKKHKDQ